MLGQRRDPAPPAPGLLRVGAPGGTCCRRRGAAQRGEGGALPHPAPFMGRPAGAARGRGGPRRGEGCGGMERGGLRWDGAGGSALSPRPRGRGSGAGGGQWGGARPAPATALQKGSGGRRSGVCRRAGQGAAGGVPAPSQFPSHFPSPVLFPPFPDPFFPPPSPSLSRSHPAPGPCGGRCAAGLCSPASPWGRCWFSLMLRGFSTPPPPPCPTAAGTASTRPAPARSSAPGSPWASTSKRPHARTLWASPHRGVGSGLGGRAPAR